MLNKAFGIVSNSVKTVLEPQGFTQAKVDSKDENEMVSLYTSENLAYSVIYFKDVKHMVLRSCSMTEEGPDNEWKTLATWMFDPETDTEKEAQGIANDFNDMLSSPVAIKRQKKAKKKAKKDEGNADPLFLAKRFVNFFPELKDEIKTEEDSYYPFRGATFAQEHIVPKVKTLVNRGSKKELEKLGQTLSTQYGNGDIDTRSIITMVILNSLDPEKDDVIAQYLSEDLQKAQKAAAKYRNKDVKPEKVKKQKRIIGERL